MCSATVQCCAECGEEGSVSLKTCKSCLQAKYCNAICQKNHWPKHKTACKLRAAELRDEALFKDPPAKEDCSICFLPMPQQLICCVSLPPATITSVPIYDFVKANEELAGEVMELYYPCCGKSICKGCIHSFGTSGNIWTCPFCNTGQSSKTDEEHVEEIMKRVEANDAGAICLLANSFYHGLNGMLQDHAKAMELLTKSAELGYSKAHSSLGNIYYEGGNMKKAKFHLEAGAMAGHEVARKNLGVMECNSGNIEQAVKDWTIAASAGCYIAMHHVRKHFELGVISRESINSTLAAYNNSCVEMRSKARDDYIQVWMQQM